MLLTIIVTSLLIRRILRSGKGAAFRKFMESFFARIKCPSCMDYLVKIPVETK